VVGQGTRIQGVELHYLDVTRNPSIIYENGKCLLPNFFFFSNDVSLDEDKFFKIVDLVHD
jgi:hypothetical protein